MTVAMFAAGVGPEQAQSNISHWLDLLGFDGAAAQLAPLVIDQTLIWVCAILLALSFWPRFAPALAGGPKPKSILESKGDRYYNLYSKADSIVSRIRYDRYLEWWERDRSEDLIELTRDGMSVILHFRKQGLATPEFETNRAEKILIGLAEYFSAMIPLLRDGHTAEADAQAANVARRAERAAMQFDPNNWRVE